MDQEKINEVIAEMNKPPKTFQEQLNDLEADGHSIFQSVLDTQINLAGVFGGIFSVMAVQMTNDEQGWIDARRQNLLLQIERENNNVDYSNI